VWMVALYRSLALRPVLIGGDTVLLQVGFLWRAEFRRDQIRSVRRFSASDMADGKPAGYLSLVVLNEPQSSLRLHGRWNRDDHDSIDDCMHQHATRKVAPPQIQSRQNRTHKTGNDQRGR
jgi:hypothetical protein